MKMKVKNYGLGIVLIITIIALFFVLAAKREVHGKEEILSANVLDFTLTDQDGNPFNLQEYEGKVIILNFWASWCPPCVYEMPSIQTFYNDMNQDEIKLVLVALDHDFEKSMAFMKKNDFSMPYYSPKGNIPSAFNVEAIPTTFIINREGKIVSTYNGMTDFTDSEFKQFITSVSR